METTLDQFYRPDTNLAYMYPAGRDEQSRFENRVAPWIEELVAMRTLKAKLLLKSAVSACLLILI